VPPDNMPGPRVAPPSMNVTVPVAVDGVTVTVKATEFPYVEGLADDVTPIVVDALFTVCA